MWINQFITQSISWLHSALGIKKLQNSRSDEMTQSAKNCDDTH